MNVVAIDDHEVALIGLTNMLGASSRCELVGAYHAIGEVLAHIHDTDRPRVDVVLLDLRPADGSDPYLNATMLQEAGATVLVYSSLESPFLVRRALQAGAAGAVVIPARLATSSDSLPADFHTPAPLQRSGQLAADVESDHLRSETALLALYRVVAFGCGVSWLVFMGLGSNAADLYRSSLTALRHP